MGVLDEYDMMLGIILNMIMIT